MAITTGPILTKLVAMYLCVKGIQGLLNNQPYSISQNGENDFFFLMFWLHHCFVQMCSFIVWNCFSCERCGLWASCYSLQVRWLEYVYEREDKTGASLIRWWRTSLYSWSIISTRQINWCCAVIVATLSEWWKWYIVNIILIKKWSFWFGDFFRYEFSFVNFLACFNFHSLNKFPSLVNLAEGIVVGGGSISISNMKVGTVVWLF